MGIFFHRYRVNVLAVLCDGQRIRVKSTVGGTGLCITYADINQLIRDGIADSAGSPVKHFEEYSVKECC